jgi:hypothetical protein
MEYLLTYLKEDNTTDFSWFETKEEMDDYIETSNIKVIEKYHIVNAILLD